MLKFLPGILQEASSIINILEARYLSELIAIVLSLSTR